MEESQFGWCYNNPWPYVVPDVILNVIPDVMPDLRWCQCNPQHFHWCHLQGHPKVAIINLPIPYVVHKVVHDSMWPSLLSLTYQPNVITVNSHEISMSSLTLCHAWCCLQCLPHEFLWDLNVVPDVIPNLMLSPMLYLVPMNYHEILMSYPTWCYHKCHPHEFSWDLNVIPDVMSSLMSFPWNLMES